MSFPSTPADSNPASPSFTAGANQAIAPAQPRRPRQQRTLDEVVMFLTNRQPLHLPAAAGSQTGSLYSASSSSLGGSQSCTSCSQPSLYSSQPSSSCSQSSSDRSQSYSRSSQPSSSRSSQDASTSTLEPRVGARSVARSRRNLRRCVFCPFRTSDQAILDAHTADHLGKYIYRLTPLLASYTALETTTTITLSYRLTCGHTGVAPPKPRAIGFSTLPLSHLPIPTHLPRLPPRLYIRRNASLSLDHMLPPPGVHEVLAAVRLGLARPFSLSLGSRFGCGSQEWSGASTHPISIPSCYTFPNFRLCSNREKQRQSNETACCRTSYTEREEERQQYTAKYSLITSFLFFLLLLEETC